MYFLKKYLFILSALFTILSILTATFSYGNNSLCFPLKTNYILTSEYGYREFDAAFHNGIDCATYENTPVYALSNGIVTYSGWDNSGGMMMIIQYDNGYSSMFCHLSENLLYKYGDRVYKGCIVAYVGPKYLANGNLNGFTTGVHLHYGLYYNGKSIDPLSVIYE